MIYIYISLSLSSLLSLFDDGLAPTSPSQASYRPPRKHRSTWTVSETSAFLLQTKPAHMMLSCQLTHASLHKHHSSAPQHTCSHVFSPEAKSIEPNFHERARPCHSQECHTGVVNASHV